ncbi:MAG: EAL domain-containing protein [Alphaproteobacteria bacterium]|nr:EAL domain-containing protein [Alphaproteobacteria bacterium]
MTVMGHRHGSTYGSEVHRDLAVAERLRWCLQNDSVALAFQPIIASGSGEVVSYECLLRLLGDGAMPHGAGPMIKVAERTGLIRRLDIRALELAVRELERVPGLRLAINVSGLTTSDRQWLRRLGALVQGRRELAERLTVEITETAAMQDLAESIRFVATLRDVGCHVALDDFGARNTSFRNLKVLAVDQVKIDGSFTASLAQYPEDIAYVAALQNLADACGLATVAEWVEDAATARLLSDHGVNYLQGYHFGRPSVTRPWLRNPEPSLVLGVAR